MPENLSHLSEQTLDIKIYPRLIFLHKLSMTIVRIGIAALFLVISLAIFIRVFNPDGQYRAFIYLFFFVSIGGFIMCIRAFIYARSHVSTLMRLERRRRAAVRGDQRYFVPEQPVPFADALPLPFTIRQPGREARFMLGLVIFMISFGMFSIPIVFWSFPLNVHNVPYFGYTLIAIIGSIAYLIEGYIGLCEKVIFTEDGIVIRRPGQKIRSILWGEACLFALDETHIARGKVRSLLFELSSAEEVICWRWPFLSSSSMSAQIPQPFPLQSFDPQLQALLSLIAGRTGLPLHDLREMEMPKAK